MGDPGPATPAAFFAGSSLGRGVFERVHGMVDALGGASVEVSRSQVAFRRGRGFAYLWLPGRYLAHPQAEVVLSIALPREVVSTRWKEVVHPSPRVWMHHLELHGVDDLDDEVVAWLREAAEAAEATPRSRRRGTEAASGPAAG